MSTIVIEKTENTQCQKFTRVHGHSVAACSSAVVDRSDFLNSEWKITYARQPQVVNTAEIVQPAPLEVIVVGVDDERISEDCIDPETADAINKVLVEGLKKNIRNLSLFTAEPLVSMLPYQMIQQFRRLIAEFKLTLGYLENL